MLANVSQTRDFSERYMTDNYRVITLSPVRNVTDDIVNGRRRMKHRGNTTRSYHPAPTPEGT